MVVRVRVSLGAPNRACSSMVEPRAHNALVGGSNPSGRTIGEKCYGSTAGSNPAGQGSIPCSPANKYSKGVNDGT